MKIGFDAKRVYHNRTGLGNYSRDLVRILCRMYPDHSYYLFNPKKGRQDLFVAESDMVVEVLPGAKWHRIFYNLWRQYGIRRDLLKRDIRLFHGLSGEIPFGLSQMGIKTVVTVHDLIFLRYPQFYSVFDRYIHKLKASYAVRNSDVIVAVSEQTKNDIVSFFKVSPDKIWVIYQGCQDVFKVSVSRTVIARILDVFNLPHHFILNVGTVEERKNILSAVKAIRDLDIHLVIVGAETAYTKRVKEYIAVNNMGSRVHFLKGVSSEELAALYQAATLFVYPSLYEGFGIPIIEALFSGTPVITSKDGCFSEAGGPSSIYVDPMDTLAFTEAIETVLTDKDLRGYMREEGLRYAKRFSPDFIGKRIMEVYQECLGL